MINHGPGETATTTWSDYIYWTKNFTTDRKPQFLGSFKHSGTLLALGKYDVSHDVTIPKYIFGTYFIFIHTDGGHDVYEHLKNENNFGLSVSSVKFPIILFQTNYLLDYSITCYLDSSHAN